MARRIHTLQDEVLRSVPALGTKLVSARLSDYCLDGGSAKSRSRDGGGRLTGS
jgi:hypothetical protein